MQQDPHSYSRPAEVKVKHLHWNARVDFDTKTITGKATWTLENSGSADTLVLDTKDLHVEKIVLGNGSSASYRLGGKDSILGQPLLVSITPETTVIDIYYKTSPQAEALQWLDPQQTSGKAFPFLFTQSQAILARSWIPCQDTPGVRFTYDATVTVPKELLALMSASNPQEKNETGEYVFSMPQAIPSYLLALAVGDVIFKPISGRSGVYAEGPVIAQAAWEFAQLEQMISAAEELYGPYRWERYDILVLPPSFPFGGMENPRLTFATPTILAGDRSLTSLVAHELAHSWSGNLVTNATWNDFWLNEGFTVYFETRIMETLYGRDYAEMLASLNLQDLHDEIKSLREKNRFEDTRLKLALDGRNPDEGVTNIAYNKGYFFLRTIEEEHGRGKFDQFLKTYFSDHAFESIDTATFIRYIKNYYQSQYNILLSDSHFMNWIETEGLPANLPPPNSPLFKEVDRVLSAWIKNTPLPKGGAQHWNTHQWLHLLKNVPEHLSYEQMRELDDFGRFTSSSNSEIITAWGVVSIRNNYEEMHESISTFLINTGRRKFLSALYNELLKSEKGRQRARKIYEEARAHYHFVATNTFDTLLEYPWS